MLFLVDVFDFCNSLLSHIEEINAEKGITNIRTVAAKEDDPCIPEPVELIYIFYTLQYIEGPDRYVRTMSGYLKNRGRIAVVDFNKNWPPLSIKFTEEKLTAWMRTAGLTLIGYYDFIQDEYLMIFEKLDGTE